MEHKPIILKEIASADIDEHIEYSLVVVRHFGINTPPTSKSSTKRHPSLRQEVVV